MPGPFVEARSRVSQAGETSSDTMKSRRPSAAARPICASNCWTPFEQREQMRGRIG
ncbi:MAG: hypothetical protein HY710_04690 [Candidatus Latescibacteria bacterium]|nr:hypothetical protein [Candidatus Latescibacterota bacterium]